MRTIDILTDRKAELEKELAEIQSDLIDVKKAIAGIMGSEVEQSSDIEQPLHANITGHAMNVDDAIILAVEAGKKTPVTIRDYMAENLGVDTTLNSVRTRVSKLKKLKKIRHGDDGWLPISSFGETAPNDESEGAPTPSPSSDLYSTEGTGA